MPFSRIYGFWIVAMLAGGAVALVVTVTAGSFRLIEAALAVTLTLWTLSFGAACLYTVRMMRERTLRLALQRMAEGDPSMCFSTAGDGRIVWVNAAARARVGKVEDRGPVPALSTLFAAPASVLYRLQAQASRVGSAYEDVVMHTRQARLSVHAAGVDRYFWRIEERLSCADSTLAVTGDGTAEAPLLERFFEDIPLSIVTFAMDGTLLSANALAREQLLIPSGEPAGIADLLEGLGRSVSTWLHDVVVGRIPPASEVLRVKRATADSFLQVTLRRMTSNGNPMVMAVLIDATAVKTLEAQFNQSQKMQAIGQLAGGIAHDFNNLLTAISGHCDLLLLRHDQDDPEYSDLMQIHQNANRAASLVGQLLAFSRKQTQKLETLDLTDVLSDLTHLLNRLVGERVRLCLSNASGAGRVNADRRQLEQVIMNLVVNARDAMMSGGEILIETDSMALTQELRRNRAVVPPGDYSVIRVIDKGVGIPADQLEKIFEPFFTTKRQGEGTGLGLSTVYGIVKQTGGFIFVDSILGIGSTFHILLPRSYDMPETTEPLAVVTPKFRPGDGVVLLVEDEAPVRAFASRALRLRGYTVLEAGSGEEALALLADTSLHVDLFVTDVVMPGLDGPSWVRRALQDRPDAHIIFVSGYAEEAFADEQAQFTNSVFLPKPFSLNDLTMTVQRQLS
ncbi:ATP-binding protein [Falsirhodobacter sp. alg1]|uniref:hybrid sensor histidine kinase/response regulator n=1 Tax=Falsirhodobacter sp. alg1 TaxID=1472418 RepID=UPI0007877F37|nr:ATP-binding protein [Falsirhodobacter sp. alg1]